MHIRNTMSVAAYTLILAASNALAQGLDQTIRIIDQPQAVIPAAVLEPIVLPNSVTEDSEAVMASAEGLGTANAARLRRAEGIRAADEAREATADYADGAQDAAESISRTDEFVPDVPEVPDPTGGR